MWVLKTAGETFYVNHVDATLPWSTKETSNNPHTKGSIKFKQCLLTINDANEATLTQLSMFDKIRLRNQKLGITRVIWTNIAFEKALKDENVKHTPFRKVFGTCGTAYSVCDIEGPEMVTLLGLKYTGMFRVLQPNEPQYKAYDDSKLWNKLQEEYRGDGDYEDDLTDE